MSDYIEVDGLRVGPCMWRNLKEELTAARDEAERLRGRVAELENALLESQDWNWITAHEEMIDNCLTDYPIDEMQNLHLVAMGKTSSAWLLRKQAEAVEACADGLPKSHATFVRLHNEAQRLRQQADEAEQ